jgi:hypothetical protein
VRLGLAPRQAVLAIYALCLLCGALGLVVQYASYQVAYLVFALVLGAGALVIFYLEWIHKPNPL